MIEKKEYEALMERKKGLREKQQEKGKELESLCREKNRLKKKSKSFKSRHSELAMRLFMETSEEIRQTELQIGKVEESMADLHNECCRIVNAMTEIDSEQLSYVEAQTNCMVKKLEKLVSDNELEFASNLKTRFRLTEGVNYERVPGEDDWYYVPTGEIIIECNFGTTITSKAFEWDERRCIYEIIDGKLYYSDWFKAYLKVFKQKLREKITNAFYNNQNFKAVFIEEENQFNIELI